MLHAFSKLVFPQLQADSTLFTVRDGFRHTRHQSSQFFQISLELSQRREVMRKRRPKFLLA